MSVEPKVLPEVLEPSGVEDWWYLLGFPKHSLGLEEYRNLVITVPASSAHRLTKPDWRDPQVTWEAISPQVFSQSCPSAQAENSCCSTPLPPNHLILSNWFNICSLLHGKESASFLRVRSSLLVWNCSFRRVTEVFFNVLPKKHTFQSCCSMSKKKKKSPIKFLKILEPQA